MRYPNLRYGNPTELRHYAQSVPVKDLARQLRRMGIVNRYDADSASWPAMWCSSRSQRPSAVVLNPTLIRPANCFVTANTRSALQFVLDQALDSRNIPQRHYP